MALSKITIEHDHIAYDVNVINVMQIKFKPKFIYILYIYYEPYFLIKIKLKYVYNTKPINWNSDSICHVIEKTIWQLKYT